MDFHPMYIQPSLYVHIKKTLPFNFFLSPFLFLPFPPLLLFLTSSPPELTEQWVIIATPCLHFKIRVRVAIHLDQTCKEREDGNKRGCEYVHISMRLKRKKKSMSQESRQYLKTLNADIIRFLKKRFFISFLLIFVLFCFQ